MKQKLLSSVFSNRSAVTQRLLKGFGANSLGKFWALLIQLISVPVLTSAWGLEGYGVWLMIATIPVYLGLSDFGLGTAAGVDMTAAMALNDRPAALQAFQSVWLFMTAVTAIVATAVILGALVWGYRADELPGQTFAPMRTAGAIGFITLAALLMIQMSILKTVFQATHKYALGTVILDLASLSDGLIVIVIALLGGDVLWAALGMLGMRLVSLIVFHGIQARLEPWCHPGWAMANRQTLRRLMHPSLSALALTLANSLGLQGIVLTLGLTMGPAVAAVFASTRMLTRIPLQFATLLSRASLPELTRAQIEGRTDLTRRLMRANVGLALISVLPFALVLTIWGNTILKWLSNGQMTADTGSFVLLGAAATLNALWNVLGMKLLATNRQNVFAWAALILYAACSALPLLPHISYLSVLASITIAELMILLRIILHKST